ncbi:hypothetical protein POM88_004159 [Heracleum sosnowskyi]|uniref:Integrase catalytic domain-containing protein n=1 Tax=Heracleum sosnowskyi TaxID=360622 RepID=A0AAD8NCB3_9APIA|nr:hypothetical protein POM88_004159 [Heracleum sosnowskyi]
MWGIDLIGELPKAKGSVKYAVVAVDYFTKWAEAEPLATITAKKLIDFVYRAIVCRFGIPYKLISDNGKQFDIIIMSEENQAPSKVEQVKPNSVSRYETIRVPILRPVEYPIWKVKMTMFLEATDPEYLDRIYDGPHMSTKLSPVVDGQEQKTVPQV